ncbi:MAG: phosphatase [Desulfuromonas sp.]|uniref:PHP domain-containing protein n=1 Tax=Desulfuromonas sp. TaxID=892 RepID=UPI000CA7DA74|nr:PHP domain-containing protein [Desulfuromonas sp.]PLX81803.1 MAG: phosphatase [Desulfuromonas sp.]
MGKLVDLHLHSNYSDGIHPPGEVLRMAAAAGLAAVAIADHDNIDGIDEALAAGRQYGVEVLSAVELSVVWEEYRDIHILGYGFDHHHPELCLALREFREFREGRSARIVERINEMLRGEGRATIDFEQVRSRAGGTVGRPHIAMALIEKGVVSSNEEAFRRYLVPCNVSKRLFPIAEAIELVHRAGGVAVLAHPPFITDDRKVFEGLLDIFVGLGLDGVEAYNSGATNADIDWYITLARRRDLIITGGSDFHGLEGGEIVIGGGRGNLKIPYRCVDEVRAGLELR